MYIDNFMYVEQYVSGSCQNLNSPLSKRHEPNASNSHAKVGLIFHQNLFFNRF